MQVLTRAIIKKLNEAGARYEGEFNENNDRHGKGRVVYIDGTYYEGQWFNGKREGWGEQRYSDGTLYKGEWKNDHKEGFGKIYYPNGNVVSASFKNDLRHGKGSFESPDGKRTDCVYYNDLEIKVSEQNPDNYGWAGANFGLVVIIFFLIIFW